ncbi:Double-stranded DNA-binding protein [uncultured Caudovirales phage]|uniref:Double-stranded DNA-binding protein n=1 Tax=uncultured Caudovirales phage TaxID=2100421 RepID=A0A6J5PEP4_9CAUD|nr:Double-stranded DNA-binding protein [uncultured Caudovirales phage]CAB4181169.1 Double-stranded DNA-binding protein [uncultured Caudovirales phage]CAB4198467.1 Double-stranded DNA-binding protein [uncultured Caudovirales phage]CAB4211455.1 Double-stranded DNA-binding protein [uncultured Caudovirales phage]CAB5238552.1 Double-stranded DNA-binding protein [uncultured Caudovirales phage]
MNYALTPEQKKTLQDAIGEISNSMIRTEAERDLIREIVKEQSDTLQIPKKVISKIAKTYHKQNLAQEVADHEDFVELYEKITSK